MSDVFINQTSPIQLIQDLEKGGAAKSEKADGGFSQLMKQALDEVNQLEKVSGQEIDNMMSGDIKDVHGAMIAMQKADLSFQMLMQVRNKLVEAYQAVMRMQV